MQFFFPIFCHAATEQSDTVRLVSTNSFVTDILFSLGVDEYLIAVDVTSHLPTDYRKLANIGYHRALSAEGLLSLQPTIVIGSEFMGPDKALSVLKQANINLIQLPDTLTTVQLRSNVTRLAKALDREVQGKKLVNHIDTQLNHLNTQNLANKRVAFLLSIDPSKLRLAGRNTGGSALITLLDGINVADFDNYLNISAESLLALEPDVIIVAGQEQQTAVEKLLKANPVLRHTPAGKHDNVLAVNGNTLISGLSIAALDQALDIANRVKGAQ